MTSRSRSGRPEPDGPPSSATAPALPRASSTIDPPPSTFVVSRSAVDTLSRLVVRDRRSLPSGGRDSGPSISCVFAGQSRIAVGRAGRSSAGTREGRFLAPGTVASPSPLRGPPRRDWEGRGTRAGMGGRHRRGFRAPARCRSGDRRSSAAHRSAPARRQGPAGAGRRAALSCLRATLCGRRLAKREKIDGSELRSLPA